VRLQLRRRCAALLAVGLVVAGLGLAPSPVSAAECPEQLASCVVVSVVKTSGGEQSVLTQYTVGPDDIQGLTDPALNASTYTLRKNPVSKGGEAKNVSSTQQRVSINKLLGALDPALVGTATFLETPNTQGIPATLSAADLADPAAPAATTPYPFAGNLPPAVFLASTGEVGFLRPLRNDDDTNAADYTKVNGRLDITVHTTGSLIAPTVTSSNGTDLDTKSPTTFSVSYADKPRSKVKRTLWDFGDGSTKGTKRDEPSKLYAKRGTYPVVATVRLDDGSYGRSAPVEVKVGKPAKAPTSGTGGGDGLGGNPGSTGDLGRSPLPSPFDPFEGDLDPPGTIEEPPVPEDLPTEPPAPVDDGLEPVEGYVLAGAEIVPGGTPETIPGTESSTTPAPATQASTRQRVATWTVAAIAVILLVGLGAASETRFFRRRLPHFRRRA